MRPNQTKESLHLWMISETLSNNFLLNMISKMDPKKWDQLYCNTVRSCFILSMSFHQLLTICTHCFSQNFLDLLQNIILCHFISDFHIVCVPFIFSRGLIYIEDTSQNLKNFLILLTMSSLKLNFKKCEIFLLSCIYY